MHEKFKNQNSKNEMFKCFWPRPAWPNTIFKIVQKKHKKMMKMTKIMKMTKKRQKITKNDKRDENNENDKKK